MKAQEFWQRIFGRTGAVEIEIGPERGTFLGIERSAGRVARIEAALAESPKPNVRVLCGDAACIVADCIPEASVATYHVYFPDPWWKRRHQRRRLLTPELASRLAATLQPGVSLLS